ncbi:MAG: acetoacetate decarboxylase family protein [Gammaproteobacteria bacterium]
MRSLKNITSIILLALCFVYFLSSSPVFADASQYEGNVFEGTNLNDHWIIFNKPPFKYENSKIVSVQAITTKEALVSMVPKELSVNEENKIIFFIGKLNIAGEYIYSYNEGGIVIPVTYKKGTDQELDAYFIPILYLDKTNPIVGGREVYGYNKHHADIELIEEEKQMRGIVSQWGKTLIDITVSTDSPKVRESIELKHGGHFVIKRIPSAAYDGTLEIHQLNHVEVSNYLIKDYYVGEGKLRLGGPDWEQLNKIPIESIKESSYHTESADLGKGKTVHDYLK